MIQDIHPHRLDMTFARRPPVADDYVVVFMKDGGGETVLFRQDESGFALPRLEDVRRAPGEDRVTPEALQYLFAIDERGVFLYRGDAGNVPESLDRDGAGDGLARVKLNDMRTHQPSWQAFVALTANHLAKWYGANVFCGTCGARNAPKADERALKCEKCGALVFPRISPAVIVGVVNGESILLTRYANRPDSKLTALIAGFAEVGESLEDTVRREVREEVGLRVRNIRYYKSQPWAFSGSLLTGFYVDLDGGEQVVLDQVELAEAVWVNRRDLPVNPGAFSLTAEMVEMFRTGEFPRGNA